MRITSPPFHRLLTFIVFFVQVTVGLLCAHLPALAQPLQTAASPEEYTSNIFSGLSERNLRQELLQQLNNRGYKAFPRNANGRELPTVIGLRGIDRHGKNHPAQSRRRHFNDTLFVLFPNRESTVLVFRYSSHPFERDSHKAPDADGRRQGSSPAGDVGMIRAADYLVIPSSQQGSGVWHAGRPAYRLVMPEWRNGLLYPGTDHIPVFRDTNHDGVFSSAERRASITRAIPKSTGLASKQQINTDGDYATGILFHQIRRLESDTSIGCQVLDDKGYPRFLSGLEQHRSFYYVLLDFSVPANQQSP